MTNRSLIIVPVDGAGDARTLRYAIGLARQRGADIDVVRVEPRHAALAPRVGTMPTRERQRDPADAKMGWIQSITVKGKESARG